MFLKGLPQSVTRECIRAPRPADFAGLVQRAQDTVALYADMNQLYGRLGGQDQNWRSNNQRPQNRNQQRSGFSQASSGAQQYNSSNAPRRFNNTPIAMDTSARTRVNRQGNNPNYRANTANVERPFKGKCFNCDMEGHISRNCKAPRRERINAAQMDEWTTFETNQTPSAEERLEASIRSFSELSLEEKGEFVNRMSQKDAAEDFQSA